MLPPGDITMIPLNWKLRLLPSHFGLLRPQNRYAKKGVTALAGVTDADYQGEMGQLRHNRSKKEYVGKIGDTLGHLSNPGRIGNGDCMQ